MNLTKCMANECSNLTTDQIIEYGTYCFKHSFMTHKPETIKNKDVVLTNTLITRNVVLGNRPRVVEKVLKERKFISPVRRAPLPVHSLPNLNEIMECCVCNSHDLDKNKMRCGHLICCDCLDHVRCMKCPQCYNQLEGPLLDSSIETLISQREVEDTKLENMSKLEDKETSLDHVYGTIIM